MWQKCLVYFYTVSLQKNIWLSDPCRQVRQIKAWNSQKQMHCWMGLLRAQLNVWWPLIDGYIKWRTAKLQLFCRWKRHCAVIMTNNFCLNHFPEITFIKRRETWVSAREARCSHPIQQISTFSFSEGLSLPFSRCWFRCSICSTLFPLYDKLKSWRGTRQQSIDDVDGWHLDVLIGCWLLGGAKMTLQTNVMSPPVPQIRHILGLNKQPPNLRTGVC